MLRDAKNFAAASAAYSEYLRHVPDDFDIWVQKGNCSKDAGDYTSALAAYATAQVIRSDDADLHMQFGHLHKLQGKLDLALASYEASAALSPNQEVLEEVRYVGSQIRQQAIAKESRQPQQQVVAVGQPEDDLDKPVQVRSPPASAKLSESSDGKSTILPPNQRLVSVIIPVLGQSRQTRQQLGLQRQLSEMRAAISRQAQVGQGN